MFSQTMVVKHIYSYLFGWDYVMEGQHKEFAVGNELLK
jgi:hypothetical protein